MSKLHAIRPGRRFWRHGGGPLLLALLTLALFSPFVFGGQSYIPADILQDWFPWKAGQPEIRVHNPLLSDILNQVYPEDRFYNQQLKQGTLALWNPYLFAGFSIHSSGWLGEVYPPKFLLNLWLSPTSAHALGLLFHVFWAGLGMYWYLRWLRLAPVATLLGAIAWMFAPFNTVHLGYESMMVDAAWLPLILLGFERAIQEHRLAFALLSGVTLGLLLLGGHADLNLFVCLLLAAVATGYTVQDLWRKGGVRRSAFYPLGLLFLTGSLGAAAGAAQLVPFVELLGQGQRSALPLAALSMPLVRPVLLLAFAFPGLLGNPATGFSFFEFGGTNYLEFQGYAGVAPLVLAFLAILLRRDTRTRCSTLLAGGALFCSLGTPFYYFLVQHVLPLLTGVNPARFLFVYAFALCVLAALGADALVKWSVGDSNSFGLAPQVAERRLRRFVLILSGLVVVAVCAVALVALGLHWQASRILALGDTYMRTRVYHTPNHSHSLAYYYAQVRLIWRYYADPWSSDLGGSLLLFGCVLGTIELARRRGRRGLWQGSLVTLCALDLLFFAFHNNTTASPTALYPPTAATDYLRADQSQYRIMRLGGAELFPNTFMAYDIAEVGGYESLYPRRIHELSRSLSLADDPIASDNVSDPSRIESPLVNLLNVKYVLAPPGTVLPHGQYVPVFTSGLAIYRNIRVLPRAFIAPGYQVIAQDSAALAAVTAPTFQPSATVILSEPLTPADRMVLEKAPPSQPATPPPVTISNYRPLEVNLTATLAGPGLLVLADTWYPGWVASVDGRPQQLYRADYTLRALVLPAGAHQVTFTYQPVSLQIGLGGSGISLVLAVTALGVVGIRRRGGRKVWLVR